MKGYVLFTALLSATSLYGQSARDIVMAADSKMRGKTSLAEIVIQTVRPAWSREMSIKTWMKGSDLAMILIKLPVKDKGIVFLKRKLEVWNWTPSLEKLIKLPPSMMSQSWMGTDFTNDDLVRESSIINDYNHSFLQDTTIDGRSCYVIEMLPKKDAPVVWGKLTVCIDKQDYLELYSRFYDEDGLLVNTMVASDVRIMDGRLIPTRFEMIPAGKPNQKTVMIYKTVIYNRQIDDGFFTTESMKSINQ
ncbi:outer membrane lipoprotein-sorting protein [Chitinophaga jiangningensis]|uniref:Outer membrane lipoprotein-sorting protein n=1 Tax=Chitinophaga jiangningensis TaxID=1419482 RepID=A0A1M6XUW9_9BACT|nr:outer membrane lipoprotein-sorting protein [Chitinophaga jiangningensis]SHL09754.1 outer membrane lipoprotein-sorting protein [Chitinophaga jiangningensis]